MKIRLRFGNSELEVEGTEAEVSKIVAIFYEKLSPGGEEADEEEASSSGGDDKKPPRKKKAKAISGNGGGAKRSTAGAKVRDDLITQLSNKIKGAGIAADVQVIFDKGSTIQKILGLWRLIPTDKELNAAEMAKMYEKFSIKVKLDNIRPAISNNKDLFIENSKDGVTYYRPTAPAMQKLKSEVKKLAPSGE